jgi:hypothetical protein
MWRVLHEDGMAPVTSGQISMRAWEYYSTLMLADKAYNFLLLCNKWKFWNGPQDHTLPGTATGSKKMLTIQRKVRSVF